MTREEAETILNSGYSKVEYEHLFQRTAENFDLFSMFWKMAKERPTEKAWRLLWILDHATEKRNDFIFPILDELYQNILKTNNESYIRQGMKLILRCPVKEEYAGKLLDKCVFWMTNPKCKISSKVLGLDFFYKTCQIYPEMAPELIAMVDDLLERSPSAGYQVRLKRIRNKLK